MACNDLSKPPDDQCKNRTIYSKKLRSNIRSSFILNVCLKIRLTLLRKERIFLPAEWWRNSIWQFINGLSTLGTDHGHRYLSFSCGII